MGSKLWPDIDMPFSARTGMRPDIIINPNAFPSRMTIGMLLESLASKAGALEGKFMDASPFQFCSNAPWLHSKKTDDILEKYGFHKYGGEILISGLTGEDFYVDIYTGCVYYHRLRHMVNDKFQVRNSGPINQLSHQPIKGRQYGGGIRFGEMERDSLLAHGAAYMLHDRLHTSSDYCTFDFCRRCGSFLSPIRANSNLEQNSNDMAKSLQDIPNKTTHWWNTHETHVKQNNCQLCASSDMLDRIAIPFVFKYLAVELAAMDIKLWFDIKKI